MTWTPDMVIEKYLEVREGVREKKKEFEEWEAGQKNIMDLCEDFLLGEMVRRNEEQIKTKMGTAYKSPFMQVTMTDRQAVIGYVCDRLEEGDATAFDLFTNAVSKEKVKALLDDGKPPPGIDVRNTVRCNIRKA